LTRTAIVTGASSGIGQACAVRLARAGWRVLAGVRREGDAPEGTEELLLDVTDAEQIRDAAERVQDLNGLVNNAGIALGSPLELVPVDQLRHQLEVNLVGQVAVTQALLPALRRAKGRIVFMGSIAGRSALPFLAPYAASKHGLEAVADSLRLELKPFGIPVSIVEPGSIRTPIWSRSAERADELAATQDSELAELYGERVAAFRRVALKRGEGGAPADRVAEVVEEALTAERPHARYLVGRDAKLRAGFERLPDRLRDRIYERVLLKG
jgi:NAD(P)-dependent dehydrogenase (short-subunit alcohol dehydrogenase family)